MFSGIVVEVGEVVSAGEGRLVLRGGRALQDARAGGSLAVNGVCLTAAEDPGETFVADVMPETLRRTNLGALAPGAKVNLEPPLRYGDEVGGHLVQGHVDGTGEVVSVRAEDNARVVRLRVPAEVLRYCVEKGSLTVDGMSLTIVAVEDDCVVVSLIPHTLEQTIASVYAPGTVVNLEADILAKYIAHFVSR